MRMLVGGLVASCVVVACASSSTRSGAGSCQIEGLYSVTSVRESGDCVVGTDPVTDTFEVSTDGTEALLRIQGITGAGCPGKINGCTWTASCEIEILDATGPVKNATVQYSYTFNATGFAGTGSAAIPPAKSVPKGCEVTSHVTGTRR